MNNETASEIKAEQEAEQETGGPTEYRGEEARERTGKLLPPEVHAALETLEAHSRNTPNFHYILGFAVINGESVDTGFQIGASPLIAFGLSQELNRDGVRRASQALHDSL